jgi:hypothetical protein
MPAHAMRGVPDIILIRNGKFIGLEVNTPTGRLSDDQIEFRHRPIRQIDRMLETS